MNILLWVLQVILAVIYALHGYLMLNPPPPVRGGMGIPDPFRLFIGVAELLAAAGLLLPGLTRRMPASSSFAFLRSVGGNDIPGAAPSFSIHDPD